MKRLLSLLLLVVLLAGCAAPMETGEGTSFIDDLGRTVTVRETKRVACLLGSFAEVWILAGGEVIAAADDAWEDFDLPLAEDAVNLGHTKEPSLEALFSAEPDFVIASANTAGDLQLKDALEAAKIPTAYFDVSDFDDYLRMLKICTDITGRSDLYETNGLAVRAQIDEAVRRAGERGTVPKVLYLRSSATSIRAKNSEGSVLGEMLANLNTVNIADTDATLLDALSMEHILMEDPDFIFFVQLGDDAEGTKARIEQFFAENPAWQGLTAVQESRVFYLDKRLYNMKPNARWGEAYLALEELLR